MLRHVVGLLVLVFAIAEAAESERPFTYSKPRELGKLQNKRINESSGLAVSRRNSDWFWTHNDSGARPRLYCFDRSGKHIGMCRLMNANPMDWEDMCSFEIDGKPKLLIADIGDNGGWRESCRLYFLDEPKIPSGLVHDIHVVKLHYSTGPTDCEAIGVDVESRQLLMVEKKYAFSCRVFQADLPSSREITEVVARPIGQVNLPIVTAMDVSSDGRRAIVLTLGQAFEFTRGKDESWASAFSEAGRLVDMPARRQGETICYGANGRDLFLTSESTPTPFFLVEANERVFRPTPDQVSAARTAAKGGRTNFLVAVSQ